MSSEPSNVPSLPAPIIRHNPYVHVYDLVVLGGGLCGIGAALAAAAEGRDVLLVERRAALAWELTSAFHAELGPSELPCARLIRRRINAVGGLRGDRTDQPTVEVALDMLVQESGIDLLLFSQPTRLDAQDDLIGGVWLGSKAGEQLVRARAFVDATEEALLWREGGTSWSQPESRPARQSVYFNMAEPGTRLPLSLGGHGEAAEISVLPSVRAGEVCVEYTTPSQQGTAGRSLLDRVVSFVRAQVPQLAGASVTHAGFEPYPLEACRISRPGAERRHPRFRNLFAAGIWMIADSAARRAANTPTGRAEIGERAGDLAVDYLRGKAPVVDGGETVDLSPASVSFDVAVAGGGTAGSIAAVAAGRLGARVLLLEAATFLGGMATGSTQYYGGHGVRGGLQDEYHGRAGEKAEATFRGAHPLPSLHPEACKIVLEEMSGEAGVTLLYGATVVGVESEGARVQALHVATPEGRLTVRAHTFVDSTGDADVALFAGAPAQTGRDLDGVIHSYSQCGQTLMSSGVIGGCNFDAGFVDPWDIVDLTRARRTGIRELHVRLARNLTAETPLMYICPLVGLRQGKLIRGDYEQSMLEQILPVQYDDCIGYASAKYDCHSQDFENQDDLPVLWVWMLGNRERGIGGEIPYRALLPRGVEGLLVACRSYSSQYEANYQSRVMRNMKRIGEAAGYAAALCARLDTTPRALDVRLVQAELRKSGALGDAVKPAPVVPQRPVEELLTMLASEDPKDAVWLLAQGGEQERALLRDFLKTGPPRSRFWAAVALAWHRDPEAVPELMRAVSDRMTYRTDYTPVSRNMRPLWQSSIVMLGRIGDARAVPLLLEVLDDPSIDMDVMIACVRALGRIRDERAVRALQNLLGRGDLPRQRKLQQTNPLPRFPVEEDGLWQVELAAAEVLAGFGLPQELVVRKHLRDSRNHVRRYARMVGLRSGLEMPPEQTLAEFVGGHG